MDCSSNCSVSRWRNCFPNIWPFIIMKISQWPQKNPKVGSKIGQILNKPSKNYQILKEFGQSGEISPSLVTRPRSRINYLPLMMVSHNDVRVYVPWYVERYFAKRKNRCCWGGGTAIDQRICLHLPSCSLRFECPASHLCFFTI